MIISNPKVWNLRGARTKSFGSHTSAWEVSDFGFGILKLYLLLQKIQEGNRADVSERRGQTGYGSVYLCSRSKFSSCQDAKTLYFQFPVGKKKRREYKEESREPRGRTMSANKSLPPGFFFFHLPCLLFFTVFCSKRTLEFESGSDVIWAVYLVSVSLSKR